MGFENQFINPQEIPKKKPGARKLETSDDPFINKDGVEQAFSKEGLLNRRFGKNVEKPSEALFYRDGILNRPKFQEMADEKRAQQEQKDADELQKVRAELGIATEAPQAKEETTPIARPEQPQTSERITEKPLLQQLVEAYGSSGGDPEKLARDAIYEHFEPGLSEEEKGKQMARLDEEYRLYKAGEDWRQAK